ncbi:hypothetical protein L0Y65_05820 [Candidatus Micrarchaeota archaeon]|nr:hypothetical protein [Candidatus Micrarchaeota archaeon]
MILGQFRPMAMKQPGEEEKEPEQAQTATQGRSSTSDEFLKTPEAKEFVNKMHGKLKEGNFPATRRGITDIMGTLHRNSNLTDKEVMKETDRILLRLGGLDGFSGVLSGLKAKSEGLVKGLKSIFGGGK